jgi:cytochrome c biogenesis protein
MIGNTASIQLKTRQRWIADAVELFSSMRFAISLLALIAVASIIGTVLRQNEPMPSYVNQFGPFWFEVFDRLRLYDVYLSWWFLLIIGCLVLSTSLCLARNTPKILRDISSWRENVRKQSLRNFHHKTEWTVARSPTDLIRQLVRCIRANGYQVKVVEKHDAALIAARKGAANKWGYLFAHGAIVIICLGGLLDSGLPIRFQQWFHGKTPFAGSGLIAQVPAQSRLGPGNPAFRGNTLIAEGGSSGTAIITQRNGVMIQDLPFTIRLERFIIDYYSTGMPKLFASKVIVRDKTTGKDFPATIKVNEPLIHDGIAVYQSGFEDGGSRLRLTGYAMRDAEDRTFRIAGEVHGNTTLLDMDGKDSGYTVEWTGFRPFNVENMGRSASLDTLGVNKEPDESFAERLASRLGSGAGKAKDWKNVGPSVQYKLRDKAGQAREFLNYMMPVRIDGTEVFLAGVRDLPDEPFRYLRIPADDDHSVIEWMRLRAALAHPALREEAAARYARLAMRSSSADTGQLREQVRQSALRSLNIFAGDGKTSGYIAVSQFLETIPAAEQGKAADIFMKILNGSMWELWQAAREQARLAPMATDEKHARFLQLAITALADAGFYLAPVYLQLSSFDEIKASVFQVTRAPGRKVVYLGCLLLVLGVFSMLYIRERRLWIWIRPQGNETHALMAMSTQRKTLNFEKEFDLLKVELTQTV